MEIRRLLSHGKRTVIVEMISLSSSNTNVVFFVRLSFTKAKSALTDGQSIPNSLNGVKASCISCCSASASDSVAILIL